jgi:hypothetical protein
MFTLDLREVIVQRDCTLVALMKRSGVNNAFSPEVEVFVAATCVLNTDATHYSPTHTIRVAVQPPATVTEPLKVV